MSIFFSIFTRAEAVKKDRRKYCFYRYNDVISSWQRYIEMTSRPINTEFYAIDRFVMR